MEKTANITVVGSNNIDLITYLERMPGQGETVTGRTFQQGFGGKGSNQAIMAKLLGGVVSIVTAVGNDAYGEQWLSHYKKEDIHTDFVKVIENESSGVAAIWVEKEGDNRIVIVPGANNHVTPEFVTEAFEQLPKSAIVLSQLENPQDAILTGFKKGKEQGAVTILNPAPAATLIDGLLEQTDWLIPNEHELAYLAKNLFHIETEHFEELIKDFAMKTNTNLVVTVGSKGSFYFMPNEMEEVVKISTQKVEVVDTTGAGDAFCGSFAFALANDFEIEQAIRLANIVASDSVQRHGTQSSYPRGERLKKLINAII